MIYKNNENSAEKWHCQPDNGTFSLWYNKTNFLPDAGVYSYNDPSTERSTYRRSTMHNTMSINNQDIKETQQLGRYLTSKSANEYEVIVTENTPYKAGTSISGFTPAGDINHRRAIFFVNNEFFTIVDEVYSTATETAEPTVNFNYHLYSEGTAPVIDGNTAKTQLANNNLLIKAFSETSTDGTLLNAEEGDIAVSTVSGSTTGNVRDWITVNETMPAGKAVRMITILYPTSGAAATKNIEAEFTDNVAGSEGVMHNGISAKVTVDGKSYNLSYTLN